MIQKFIRSYEASAAVVGFTIARFSDVSASRKVATASAATDPIVGVFDAQGGASGDMVDVHLSGIAPVKLGGTVTAGQPITSDAAGLGIAATATAATTKRIIGFADEPGVAGDIIDVRLAPGLFHQG